MSSWELSNSFWGILFTSKTYYAVYLLLRDVKLFLRDSIYKLYINTVYLLLRDAKRLMRDSIYKLYKNSMYPVTSFWWMPNSFWGIPFTSYT